MYQATCSIFIGLWEEYCHLQGILNNNLSQKLFIYLHYLGDIIMMKLLLVVSQNKTKQKCIIRLFLN